MRGQRIDRGMTVLGGLVATLAMTVFLYLVLPTLRRDPFMLPTVLESLFGLPWVAGVLLHLVLGTFVFPLLFIAIYDVLPGRSWVRGMIWGSVLWFVAELVVVPIAGGGFFHAESGGLAAVMGFLGAHLLYGAALGGIARASVPRSREASLVEERRVAGR